MLLSVVTPTLNAEKTVRDTLASVAARKGQVEHIVVDGGSTDHTLTMVREFPHVSVIHQQGRGISAAMNQGIAKARGKFISILNADDYFNDDFDFVFAHLAADGGDDRIYFGDIIELSANNQERQHRSATMAHMQKYMSIYHPSMIVPKQLYSRLGGYKEAYRFAMDCEFVHRCMKNNIEFEHIPLSICTMRLGGTSHINTGSAMKEFERSVVAAELASPLNARLFRIRQTCFHTLLKQPMFRMLWRKVTKG